MVPFLTFPSRDLGEDQNGTEMATIKNPDAGLDGREELDEEGQGHTAVITPLSMLEGGTFLAGIVANLLIFSVSSKPYTGKKMLILNFALANLLVLLIIPVQTQASRLQQWNLPHFLCPLCAFLQVLSVNVSVFTLLAIAVDLYRAVMFPPSVQASVREAAWGISFIWFAGLVLAIPTGLDYNVTYLGEGGELELFCLSRKMIADTQSLVAFQYFFPLLITMTTMAVVMVGLWRTNSSRRNEGGLENAAVAQNERKALRMLTVLFFLFTFCWLPAQTYNFLQPLTPTISQYEYINILWFCFELGKIRPLLALI